jgi:glutamyl-tRNA synthetase
MFKIVEKILKKDKSGGSKVVTRIAPSPTGVLHIGTARTALFNYLYAKQNDGKFILRIEDTDKERSTDEFEKNIVEGLNMLGMSFDAFYKQSERTQIYQKYLNKLIKEKKAYISKEENGNRDEVIRFKNPNKKITFNDMIRGEITFDTTELGDFVIAKSITEPLYHLAVVVDDFEMGITHVIRGEDGISNTPRQMLIQEAIGAANPTYAHLPLILGKDKSKLSKRHGATSLSEFKERGYLTEAILNHLAFLGWNPGGEKELYNLDELIEEFSIEKVQKGGAIFNEEKLDWFNHEYLKNLSNEELVENIKPYLEKYDPNDEDIIKIKNIILERINVFSDIKNMVSEGELDYYFETPIDYDVDKIIWKKSDKETTLKHLHKLEELISDLDEEITEEKAKEAVWSYAEENGKGDVLWPLRYTLSNKERSPDPFSLLSILGKKESLHRIQNVIKEFNE